jgi:hypothetical protein
MADAVAVDGRAGGGASREMRRLKKDPRGAEAGAEARGAVRTDVFATGRIVYESFMW